MKSGRTIKMSNNNFFFIDLLFLFIYSINTKVYRILHQQGCFFVIVETFPHNDLNGNTDRLLYICLVFELSFPHFGNNYCFVEQNEVDIQHNS